jgi:membrane associated rhomboid family serine protease
MLIPLRPRITLTRIPWLTLFVTGVCILVFIAQDQNWKAIHLNAINYCTPTITRAVEDGQKYYFKHDRKCPDILLKIYLSRHPEGLLQKRLDVLRSVGGDERAYELERIYKNYSEQAPRYLTSRLWHPRGSWNPVTMVTSTFSHSGWDHLLGNLFFFVSFSLIVETVLGAGLYIFVYLAMALGIAAVDNFVHFGTGSLPTLGLSGMVMGMMVLAAYFAPRVRIDYFYILIVLPGVQAFPLWMVSGLYILWNVADIYAGGWSPVNYVAHLAGAIVALMLASTLFRSKRHWADEFLLEERRNNVLDSSWIEKLRQWTMVPLVVFVVAVAYLWLLQLLIQLMSDYSVQVLIITPFAIASWYLYTSYREHKDTDQARMRATRGPRHQATTPFPTEPAIRYQQDATSGVTRFETKRDTSQVASHPVFNEPTVRIADKRSPRTVRRRATARAAPFLVAIAMGVAVWILIQLISTYTAPVLIGVPIVIVCWSLLNLLKGHATTDSARFKKAMADIANRRVKKGIDAITQLAEGGYTRAQVELAKLHELGNGVLKLPDKASQWYRRAAESGNAEAQYRLGVMMLHGQTTYQQKEEPLEWLEKSAKQGLPEAAMSLAHYFARGRGHETDIANACAWYHRAGELFLRQRRFEDAEVTIKEIKSLDPTFDQLSELENNFARLTS